MKRREIPVEEMPDELKQILADGKIMQRRACSAVTKNRAQPRSTRR